jgi:hypothetical protein
MPARSATLSTVAHWQAEAECTAANVEENDYTVFSCQDLELELELVVHVIAKKITFIDNQVRRTSSLSLLDHRLRDWNNDISRSSHGT